MVNEFGDFLVKEPIGYVDSILVELLIFDDRGKSCLGGVSGLVRAADVGCFEAVGRVGQGDKGNVGIVSSIADQEAGVKDLVDLHTADYIWVGGLVDDDTAAAGIDILLTVQNGDLRRRRIDDQIEAEHCRVALQKIPQRVVVGFQHQPGFPVLKAGLPGVE